MCGLAVIFGQNAERKGAALTHMLKAVESRGDVTETFKHPIVLTGTRRLKILDRERATQPIFNQTGDKLIIFNGEIFNFQEIKSKIKSKYIFTTESDTEAILYAFEEYGKECPHYFEGQFAFVIIDLKTNSIFYARDPVGIIPLYYVHHENLLYISSNIKALTFLNQKIYSLSPGCYKCNDKPEIRYYVPKPYRRDLQLEPFLKHLKHHLTNAVKKRVNTDLPVGVIFSGGLDSSVVLSQAVKFNANVTAFTIGSTNNEDFEISQRFSKERGIRQIIIPLKKNVFKRSHIQTAIKITELSEYGDIINAVITLELFKRIHDEGIKIVLGGDGSDELFEGYNMYTAIDNGEEHRLFLHKLMNLQRTELQRIDRCGMAFGVETRVPFLDKRVIELALTMPKEWKIRNGIGKWGLRRTFSDELPDYIVNRPKNPLSHSSGLHEWIRVYKIFFQKYYNAEKYWLHEPIRKDFSHILQEHKYCVDDATQAIQTPTNYSRYYLILELLKAFVRIFFGSNSCSPK